METKKLNGDITVNRHGDFIRALRARRGKEFKEGIYSPITQNTRHLKIVKDMLSNQSYLPFVHSSSWAITLKYLRSVIYSFIEDRAINSFITA